MKLSTIQAAVAQDEEGAVIPIEGKDGEEYTAADGSPCTITVLGSESKKYRATEDKQTRRVFRQQRTKLEPADILNNRIELATAAVVAWHGWEDDNGAEIPCTPENVSALFRSAPHVLKQAEAAIQGHARFFAKSSTD